MRPFDRTAEPRGYSQSNNDRRDLAAYILL